MSYPLGITYPVHARAIDYSAPLGVDNLSTILSQEFSMQANDTLPTLDCLIVDANGAVVDLTNASTILFEMTPLSNLTTPPATKVSTTANIVANVSITATDGTSVTYPHVVRYSWTGTDTDTPATYSAQFEITFDDGKKLSARIHVQIIPELAE